MPEIASSIVEVTVFPDRARVARRGAASLPEGIQLIEFKDLPALLVPDSLRAAGRGTAVAALLGVDSRVEYFSETPVAAIRDLERQIEQLTDQDQGLVSQEEAAALQVRFLNNLASHAAEQLARGLGLGRADLDRGEALLSFLPRQLGEAQAALAAAQRQRRELDRQITKLRNELNGYRSGQMRQRYRAAVEVEVRAAGDLTLDLTYMLSQASWTALYDVRFVEGERPSVQLTYLAQVTQQTGEDWRGVALTLSTARPALTSVRPELNPWFLRAYEPPPVFRAAAFPPPPPGYAPMAAAPPQPPEGPITTEAPPVEMELDQPGAQVSEQGASVTFKLSQSVDIPSDGSPHKVTVASFDLVPRVDYLSVPKLAECAYRRLKLANQSEYLLLPGQANLFVEGDYVGSVGLPRVAPNEEFDLTLGVDDRVLVKRELKAQEVDKRMFQDRRRLRYGYEIELQNLRPGPIQLEVRDQAPVARHEQIKVKLEAAEPRPAEQTELNELIWRLTLEPGAKRVLRFDFSVEHPTGMTVLGLP